MTQALTSAALQELARQQEQQQDVTDVHMLQGGRDRGEDAAVLTKASSMIRDLLSRFYIEQYWTVPWPRPLSNPLIFVPNAVNQAFSFPVGIPLVSELEFASWGLLDAVNLAHFPTNPRAERALRNASVRLEEHQQPHTPYHTLSERNTALTKDDLDLVDVDFASDDHNSRYLPTMAYMNRPLYNEIEKEATHQQKEELAARDEEAYRKEQQQQQALPSTEDIYEKNMKARNTTFKNANQLDVDFGLMCDEIARRKLGLDAAEGDGSGGGSTRVFPLARTITQSLLRLFAFITSNGICAGQIKNNDNGRGDGATNSRQGAFITSTIWVHICRLASEYRRSSSSSNTSTFNAEEWAETTLIAANVLPRASSILQNNEVSSQIFDSLYKWVVEYEPMLRKCAASSSSSLEHTQCDYNIVPLTDSPVTEEERKSLLLASNLHLPRLIQQLSAVSVDRTPQSDNPSSLVKTNGAVPLAIYPVLPDNFENVAADKEADDQSYLRYQNTKVVTLNGEKNLFVSADSTPTTRSATSTHYHTVEERIPQVLFGELFLQPASERDRDSNSSSSPASGPTPPLAGSYKLTRSGDAGYSPYLEESGSSTSHYLLKLRPDDEFPCVTYARIPSQARYQRSGAGDARSNASSASSSRAEGVTICYDGTEETAAVAQRSLMSLSVSIPLANVAAGAAPLSLADGNEADGERDSGEEPVPLSSEDETAAPNIVTPPGERRGRDVEDVALSEEDEGEGGSENEQKRRRVE